MLILGSPQSGSNLAFHSVQLCGALLVSPEVFVADGLFCDKKFCIGAFIERRASMCLLCPCDHLGARSGFLCIVWTCAALPYVQPRAELD